MTKIPPFVITSLLAPQFSAVSTKLLASITRCAPPHIWFNTSFHAEGDFHQLQKLYEGRAWWMLSPEAIDNFHWASVQMTASAKLYNFHRILVEFLHFPSCRVDIFECISTVSAEQVKNEFCGDVDTLFALFKLLSQNDMGERLFGHEETVANLMAKDAFISQFDLQTVIDDARWDAICSSVRVFRKYARNIVDELGL
jgi:hypothetical protein